MMRAAFLSVAFVLCGCGPRNQLGGSLGEAFDFEFSTVQIRRQDDQLLVEYLQEQAGGADKVCKVVVDLSDVEFRSGLSFADERFIERVSIQRVAREGGPFPDFVSGTIDFGSLAFDDLGLVSGGFGATSDSGRSIFGRFSEVVFDAEDGF